MRHHTARNLIALIEQGLITLDTEEQERLHNAVQDAFDITRDSLRR